MDTTRTGDPDLLLSRMRDLTASGQLMAAVAAGRAATAAGPAVSPAQAPIMTELAWLGFQTGAGQVGLDDADRAIASWRKQGNSAQEARAQAIRALIEVELGHGEAAAEQSLSALALAQASGSKLALSWALNMVGVVFWYVQQHARAAEHCAQAVALARGAEDPLLVGLCLVNLAGVQQAMAAKAREAGDKRAADACFERALLASREAVSLLLHEGELAQRVICLLNLAVARLARGEIAHAAALLAEVDALPAVDGDRVRLFRDEVAVEVLLASGRHADALPLIERGLAAAEQASQFEATLNAVRQLAEAQERLGLFAEALATFKRRHALEGRLTAERIQQQARMAEVILGLRRLEAEMADVTRERESIARSLAAISRQALDLAQDVRRDALTGISNRRHLDETLAATAADARFAVAMIDIDHFKSINDRFSHMAGDVVLRRFAQTLQRCSRPGDIVARFGGEEFVLLMYGADVATGRRICHQLRLALRVLEWEATLPSLTVTASFGLVSSTEASGREALLALADRRLYAAKRGGRDRVVSRGGGPRADRTRASIQA